MITAKPTEGRYLGMAAGDLEGKAYAKYWIPTMKPLAEHVKEALLVGPISATLLPPIEKAEQLLDNYEAEIENGYSMEHNGSLHMAVLTEMPNVTPAMVDWWFGWHSEEPQRYKLWHPQAHVFVQWGSEAKAANTARERYVGRTSLVDEYLGGELGQYNITFLPPSALGIAESKLVDDSQNTVICARVGFAFYPINIGYLIHHVKAVSGGSVMRSRFYVGGPYAGARSTNVVNSYAMQLAKTILKPKPQNGHALMVHCAQEMAHLARFLPDLYREMGTL